MRTQKISPAFVDNRGAIYDILDGEDIIHVGMITSKKGSIRGSHYHKESRQYIFVLSGRIDYMAKDLANPESKVEVVSLGADSLVVSDPMEMHGLRFLEDSVILVLTTKARSGTGYIDDTVRVELGVDTTGR